MVNDVRDDALAQAMAWAREVADLSSPSSTAVMKRQLLAVDGETLDEALESSMAHMHRAFLRPDLGEAITARIEKRVPRFPPRAD